MAHTESRLLAKPMEPLPSRGDRGTGARAVANRAAVVRLHAEHCERPTETLGGGGFVKDRCSCNAVLTAFELADVAY